MGSDVGQIFPTASLHRDHSISYALVCEKELSHMGENNENPDLVYEKFSISILRGPEEFSHPSIVLFNNQLCVSMIEFRERILDEVYNTDIHVKVTKQTRFYFYC